MDKTLLKAYIRTIVEEEVKKILPDLLSEAVMEIKQAQLTESSAPVKKSPSLDRGRLAELLNISYDGETLRAGTNNINVNRVPEDHGGNVNPVVKQALNRDYSALMKAMNLT